LRVYAKVICKTAAISVDCQSAQPPFSSSL
jgi:hypothetical protein